jgi:hypothetical protein
MATIGIETHPTTNSGAQPILTGVTLRYLALLLLLTPLVGGVQVLARPAASALPQVITQVIEVPQMIEVPQTVYVMVPVPTVVVVEVPAGAGVVPAAAEVQDEELEAGAAGGANTSELDGLAGRGSETAAAALVRPVAAGSIPRSAAGSPAESTAEESVAPSTADSTDEPMLAEDQAASDEPPAPPVADQVPEAVAAARRSLDEFHAHTELNWSIQGYSSAEEMRQALGNSQTNWLDRTRKVAAQGQSVTTRTVAVVEESPAEVLNEPGDDASDESGGAAAHYSTPDSDQEPAVAEHGRSDRASDDNPGNGSQDEDDDSESDGKKSRKSQGAASNRSGGGSKSQGSRR